MKTKRFLSLAAIFAIALAFFACSSGSPSGQQGQSGEPSSDSSGGSQMVFCKLNSGTCSQKSFSTCMELVNAGEAQIVTNCTTESQSSSSNTNPTQSSSSSSVSISGYCDYGPLVTQLSGEVTGGCYPIGTVADKANCELPANNGRIVSSCPVTSGTFTDSRDSKPYKWVKIGTQTWMAQNLNYLTTGSTCYDCAIYGRLYDWATARTVCPSDWRLPTDAEWTTLVNHVDGGSLEGAIKLKAKGGLWNNNNGTDNYGFSALPGGFGDAGIDGADRIGLEGYWWTATEYNTSSAYYRSISQFGYSEEIGRNYRNKNEYLFSVRCIKN